LQNFSWCIFILHFHHGNAFVRSTMFWNFHSLFSHQTLSNFCKSLLSFILCLEDVAWLVFIQIFYSCWWLSYRFHKFFHFIVTRKCILSNDRCHITWLTSFRIGYWRTTFITTILHISRSHIVRWDVNFMIVSVIVAWLVFLLLWMLWKWLLKLNLLGFIFNHQYFVPRSSSYKVCFSVT